MSVLAVCALLAGLALEAAEAEIDKLITISDIAITSNVIFLNDIIEKFLLKILRCILAFKV